MGLMGLELDEWIMNLMKKKKINECCKHEGEYFEKNVLPHCHMFKFLVTFWPYHHVISIILILFDICDIHSVKQFSYLCTKKDSKI